MYSIIDPVTYEQYEIFSVEGKKLLKKYVQSYQYMQKGGGDDEIESFSLNEDTYGEITYTPKNPSRSLNPETLGKITYAPSLNSEYVDIQRRPPEKKGTENQKGGAQEQTAVEISGLNNDQLDRVVQYFINDFVQSNDQVNQFHFDPRSLRRLRGGVARAIQVYNTTNGLSNIDLDALAHGEDYIREINPEEWEHILWAATNNDAAIPLVAPDDVAPPAPPDGIEEMKSDEA